MLSAKLLSIGRGGEFAAGSICSGHVSLETRSLVYDPPRRELDQARGVHQGSASQP